MVVLATSAGILERLVLALGLGRAERLKEDMKLERKHGWPLVAIAIWNFVVWGTFIKNLAASHASGEDRPGGYYVAHSVLIVVDLAIGVVLGLLGLKILRKTPKNP